MRQPTIATTIATFASFRRLSLPLYLLLGSFILVESFMLTSTNNARLDFVHKQRYNVEYASTTVLYGQSLQQEAASLSESQNNTDSESSDSYASMLLKMQKGEQSMQSSKGGGGSNNDDMQVSSRDVQKLNPLKDQDSPNNVVNEKEKQKAKDAAATTQKSSRATKNTESSAVKALDDSVYILPRTSVNLLKEGLRELPQRSVHEVILQEGLNASTTAEKKVLQDNLLPLSRPIHYQDRINRDLRLLAISIASSTETVEQWQFFCRDHGGIYILLETIRDGSRIVQNNEEVAAEVRNRRQALNSTASSLSTATEKQKSDPIWLAWLDRDRREEAFQEACSACRALRDLCAISPELAAVITDGILRANAVWNNTLLSDIQKLIEYADVMPESTVAGSKRKRNRKKWNLSQVSPLIRKSRKEVRTRCKLYIHQLLLAMAVASDDAVHAIRDTPDLKESVIACSSYARRERRRRWLRYPKEIAKWLARSKDERDVVRRPFLEAANVADTLEGHVQRSANQLLAAMGHNEWIPKIPGQRGLRILCLDGGGSRGMSSVTAVKCLTDACGKGIEVSDAFDIIAGTSTGGIISFLTGLRRETSTEAVERYNQLIKQIFVKSALSTPLLLFTTASYDESPFMSILSSILGDRNMLDSRADPRVPYVFCVTSKMSSTPTHVALFRNYNYAEGELPDPLIIDPDQAREELGLLLDMEHATIRDGRYQRIRGLGNKSPGVRVSSGSRHPGSFRVLQRYAIRASTAAPTVFKPVMMGGEMYCDGGIVASNPTAVAIHEARTLFPDIPIELVVSIGTGGFYEQKSPPRIGWDGILGQIINSATDAEQIHHVLEDVLGDSPFIGRKASVANTRYFRFNPVIGMPDEFPIDVTDPDKLARLRQITRNYMEETEQKQKLETIASIISGRNR